ncbi:hypothetical protein MPSEU_001068200 [Mayamaea pseudoterrestris]|nr:hypothetical protein MPSEU_001068200 [Mayamaea pseudoterrestris]
MRALLPCTSATAFLLIVCDAWSGRYHSPESPRVSLSTLASLSHSNLASSDASFNRRKLFNKLITIGTIAMSSPVQSAMAAEDLVGAIPFKEFSDSLFTIRLPKNYFAIRRTAKGDLPDSSTGKGRRGATIFTGGDMQKAELIAIERYPVRLLLEDNGIEANGKLDTFPDLGEPQAVANLISLYREKDRSGGGSKTILVPDSLMVTADGKDLTFQLKTDIDVQKPELLLEQYGVSRLIRVTVAKATLRANDGNLLIAFGSALETDYNGPDGQAIQATINSFQATDQSAAIAK